MKTNRAIFFFTTLTLAVFCCQSHGADWKRIDSKTIRGDGALVPDELKYFLSVYDDSVSEIQLGNIGGSVKGSLNVAKVLLEKRLNVKVVGGCLSSCANYLFLAGNKKHIADGGVVGFHGSPYAGTLIAPNWKSIVSKFAKNAGWHEAEVAKEIRAREAVFQKEKEFFSAVNIDISLLVKSIDGQRDQLVSGCSSKSLYLFPTAKMFREYGVENLTGDQSWMYLFIYGDQCIDAVSDYDMAQALEKTSSEGTLFEHRVENK